MKISFLAPHLKKSGGVRIILMYANLLAGLGHDVTVYVQSNNRIRRSIANILQIGKPDWVKDFKPRVIRVPDFSDNRIAPADHVISTTIGITDKMMELGSDKGQKYYLIQHKEGLYHAKANEDEARTFGYDIPKIVVSSWLKEIIENEYKGHAELLLNPIDRQMFYPWPREKSRDEIRVMLLQHNYEWKGTKEGAEIVNELKKKYTNLRLIMWGLRGEQPDYPCDEYYFDLPQERLAWIYSNSDIYLCPSWDEGSGLPNMEAMACKCAVVTYDNGGSRDFAFDGQTAMVARRCDKEDLKNKLETLINDAESRTRIADAGFEQIMSMPTWAEQAKRFEKILLGQNNDYV